MAAIETTEEIMDRLKLNVARIGIATIRKLQILFAEHDPTQTNQISNEEFVSVLTRCSLYLPKVDVSSIMRHFKVSELDVNYSKFMDELSPPLTPERELIVQKLFNLIKQHTNDHHPDQNIILGSDLLGLCNFENHPAVQSGQMSPKHATQAIKDALDGIQNDKDEITNEIFKQFFRGFASGYPYNTAAFNMFIQCCWNSVFQKVSDGNLEEEETKQYIKQIEAMLAEKARQKVKGSESENNALLRQFKHFDVKNENFVNYAQFVHALEYFGILAPQKELEILFEKWCVTEDNKKRLYYRPFIKQLFTEY